MQTIRRSVINKKGYLLRRDGEYFGFSDKREILECIANDNKDKAKYELFKVTLSEFQHIEINRKLKVKIKWLLWYQ